MNGKIRLGCHRCDRDDFDGVETLPKDWCDIQEVQSYEDAMHEISANDPGSAFDWQTHLGTCPECQVHDP